MEKNKNSLIEYFPEFEELINSEHFAYAEKLIQMRISLELSFQEVAEIVEYSPEEYISFEYGEQSIDLEEYENALEKLKIYAKRNENKIIDRVFTYEFPTSNVYNKDHWNNSKQFEMNAMKWVG